MKKIVSVLLLVTLVAGCATAPKTQTSLCKFNDGDLNIDLSIISQGEKILSHTAKTSVDFSNDELSEADVLKLIDDSKAKIEKLEGYTITTDYKDFMFVETITVDYAKVDKTGIVENSDHLEYMLSELKEQGFTC